MDHCTQSMDLTLLVTNFSDHLFMTQSKLKAGREKRIYRNRVLQQLTKVNISSTIQHLYTFYSRLKTYLWTSTVLKLTVLTHLFCWASGKTSLGPAKSRWDGLDKSYGYNGIKRRAEVFGWIYSEFSHLLRLSMLSLNCCFIATSSLDTSLNLSL